MTRFSHVLFSAAVATNIAFSRPVQFSEALQSRQVRSILPTTLSSAELQVAMEPSIRERAIFSARVTSAEYLGEIDDITRQLLNGEIDEATARTRLKVKLREIGYEPDPAQRGKITDFGSERRLKVVIETNARIAQGYGQFIQGQDPAVLDAFPAQELFRLESKKNERTWAARWDQVGGTFSDGRMIALKDDDIWELLGTSFDDSLGNPYPPFAFNSGMWVKDVSRKDAMEFGLIDRDKQVEPQDRGFNDDLKYSAEHLSEALQQALEESVGPFFEMKDGVLTHFDITQPERI